MTAPEAQGVLGVYRTHPAVLLGIALLVFGPLSIPRFFAIDAARFPLAIGLSLLGHVLLTVVIWRYRGFLCGRFEITRGAVVSIGLIVVTGLEIIAGLGFDAVLGIDAGGGRSTLVVTLGGTVPSILFGPAWALLVVGFAAGRMRTSNADSTPPEVPDTANGRIV